MNRINVAEKLLKVNNLVMKLRNILILLPVTFLSFGCSFFKRSTSSSTASSLTSQAGNSSSQSSNNSQPGVSSQNSATSTSSKVTVAAHTLSDGNPPINLDSKAEKVTEATWNSFKNGSASKFNGNYNYTYRAIYNMGETLYQQFTKDGYYMRSPSGKLYYERKSGSTFYQYIDVSDGWLREETTLDLQNIYTSRIVDEIYVHMFDFSDYEYDEDIGYTYYGPNNAFSSRIRFQQGYLTYLFYSLDGGKTSFIINSTFETTIDIPKSYYYS